MMRSVAVLSRLYAHAFGGTVKDRISPDMVNKLEEWSQLWQPRAAAVAYLKLDNISAEVKERIVLDSAAAFESAQVLQPLVHLLVQHGRLWLIGLIIKEYVAWYRLQQGIAFVRMYTVVAPTEQELADVRRWVMNKSGFRQVEIEVILDSTLLAGIRLESSSFVWEHSVRQQLRSLTML